MTISNVYMTLVGSGGGAVSVRVRCIIRGFRFGAQSGSHTPVSTPCLPNRTCGFPASGSPVGSCLSHAEHRCGASPHGPAALCAPGVQKLHGFARRCPSWCAIGPVNAPMAPSRQPANSAPSLTHVMLRDSLPLEAGFVGRATPAGLRPSVITPHLRPLPSTGVTPRLRYYGPLRHPAGPACPSRGPGCRVPGTGRASRVAALSIFHACRRHYPGGNRPVRSSLSSRPAVGLPLITGGSASASSVSRPARRSLAFRPAWSLSRPRRPFYQSASAHVVTSMNRPGRYQPERQLLGGIRTHQESAPFHGAL